MAKQLSQKAIKELVIEWASLQLKIRKAEEAKVKEMHPIVERHNFELAPVVEKHDKKIEKLNTRSSEIYSQVIEWLKAQPKSLTLDVGTAIAAFFKGKKQSKDRVIDVKAFLEFAKTKGEDVYKCIAVGVAAAEKLIGKDELNKICSKPDKDVEEATLQLKPQDQ